ncbi:MAG: hypothetical protein CL843_01410 [Crocinitomicaceae bacterium]|nr:hypothetical protein [Crocinitomicaceae bacterium]|tara:strand:- start:7191 stop:7991 length:801 start_codon:yes stop_codon:yes gene_type:complete
MMAKGSKFLMAFLFLFVGTFSVNAQKDVESFKAFVSSIYTDYISQGNQSYTEDDFRNLFVVDFQGTDVEVTIDGNVEVEDLDRDAMVNLYSLYQKATTLDINFSIAKYNTVEVKGSTGVASFEVNFELAKNGQTMSKGQQMVVLTAVKYGSSWKITFMNRVYVQSEVFKGACVCELLSGGNVYGSFLTVPEGASYQSANDRFEVVEVSNARLIKMNGSDMYPWNKETDQITTQDGKVIGEANLPETAIALILQSIYEDKCQSVVTK